MRDNNNVCVLIVDDEPDKVSQLRLSLKTRYRIAVKVRTPDAVKMTDLKEADLVLVDHDLGRDRDSFDPLCAPNGLALAAILRQYLREEDEKEKDGCSPTGFALCTAKLNQAAYPLTKVARRHLLARHNNVEWVFDKKDPRLAEQIFSLARAVRDIPKSWADGIQNIREVSPQLGFKNDATTLERYQAVIEPCHPPIYEVTQWSHGLAFLRWLLHDILMYPCFLWDSHRAAARLRIRHDAFLSVLKGNSELAKQFAAIEYSGMLHDFDGKRWWRHEVEALVWKITDGQTQNAQCVRAAVGKLAKRRLPPSDSPQPVVCVDKTYQALDQTFDVSYAVRVQPDDWPPYADSAWMTKNVVSGDQELLSLVVHEDRSNLT